jgi:glycosyltransferase involved in cell wall biosynthesis
VPPLISVIIPNHNGEKTIGLCLEAAFSYHYDNFEVIVVDDCSADNSVSIIEQFPCKLFQLTEHGGASRARNFGARESKGEVLFFIDADCLLQADTLTIAAADYKESGPQMIIGGTYTLQPFDESFFAFFQSVYIHYSETKKLTDPDYIATHAMLISADLFKKSGGFNEAFLPILEDVEFCHRLKKSGAALLMNPQIQVQHIFNFNLVKSLRNGFRKSKYWTMYSIKNRDLLSDSGTASQEFKFNIVSFFLILLLTFSGLLLQSRLPFIMIAILMGANLFLNRVLLKTFYKASGIGFAIQAAIYYMFVYPFAVGLGALLGALGHHFKMNQ